jgi:anti-anti-sigma regulatory factor
MLGFFKALNSRVVKQNRDRLSPDGSKPCDKDRALSRKIEQSTLEHRSIKDFSKSVILALTELGLLAGEKGTAMESEAIRDIEKLQDPERHFLMRLEKVDNANGYIIFRPVGYIDGSNVDYLIAQMRAAFESGFPRLIFSFKDIPSTRSTLFYNALINAMRGARSNGGDLVLIDLPQTAVDLIRLLGFERYFTLRKDVAEAVAYLRGADKE